MRVRRRLTRGRVTKRTVATIFRFPKRATSTLTRATAFHLQLRRAPLIEIGAAPGGRAGPGPAACHHHHRQIVAVDEADVVVVHGAGAERELSKCRRWGSSGAVAVELTGAAIGGGTLSGAGSVELATGSPPESTGPTGRSLEVSGSSFGKFKTRASDFWFS